MIKLSFDQETKIISTYEVSEEDIQEKEEIKQEEKKVIQIKLFFEKNKIFFEMFSSILLSIMSLIISFVGWQTNKRSVEIYQKQLQMQQAQLEIQSDDREPYFTIRSEPINEDYLSIKRYIVKNEGGRITNGIKGLVYLKINILFLDNDHSCYYVLMTNAFFKEKKSTFSYYDEINKEFVFYGYDYNVYEMFAHEIETELRSLYEDTSIIVTVDTFFDLWFNNYKNEECMQDYSFTENEITSHVKGFNGLESMEFGADTSSIAYEIYEKIEDFQK